jgi:DNA-binding LacI/PurR family transcriptional regulator
LLPGVLNLARELGVSKDTVRGALQLLENEGMLKGRGAGKRRAVIGRRETRSRQRVLRVAILLDEHLPSNNAHSQELFVSIKYTIEAAGHTCVFGLKSLAQLRGVEQLARFVRATKADAWIVYSATREVLEWFARRKTPVLAIGGRALGLPIASAHTDIGRAMATAVDALVTRGHRRIVLIAGSLWRDPVPSLSARTFLESLEHHRLRSSSFNMPAWEESSEGLERLMVSLFRTTPPTALIIVEPSVCVAALIFLAGRGLVVPRDLSLVSLLPDPAFSFYRPAIAHFEWTIPALVERAALWIECVALGKPDRDTMMFHAKFHPGGTIASVNQ